MSATRSDQVKNTNKSDRSEHVTVRFDKDDYDTFCRIAIEEKRTKSEVIRRLTRIGLKNSGYRPDDERLRELIRDVVQEVMKPHVERLASISAKAANIDAASFFLLVYVGRLMLPPSERLLVDEAAENARRLGIEFLKLKKDRDLDEFIRAGAENMRGD